MLLNKLNTSSLAVFFVLVFHMYACPVLAMPLLVDIKCALDC